MRLRGAGINAAKAQDDITVVLMTLGLERQDDGRGKKIAGDVRSEVQRGSPSRAMDFNATDVL